MLDSVLNPTSAAAEALQNDRTGRQLRRFRRWNTFLEAQVGDANAEMAIARRRFDRRANLIAALPNPERIVDCSPDSRLTQFERVRLIDVIARNDRR